MNPQSEKSFHYLKCAVKRALENFGELFLLNHIDTRCVQWQHAGSGVQTITRHHIKRLFKGRANAAEERPAAAERQERELEATFGP